MGSFAEERASVELDTMRPEDWPAICAIYEEGIASNDATFERRVPPWARWDTSHLPAPRLVGRRREEVVGWSALAPISVRPVYAGVAEVSIYVALKARGKGVGLLLLRTLVERSENLGIWTLQAGIFPENAASIRVHERAGFRVVGVRDRLGCMDGKWRDVLLMERRSNRVGL